MRAQVHLLEYLVGIWDHVEHHLQVAIHILILEIEDIYFLTRNSKRGSCATIYGKSGGDKNTNILISDYCVHGTIKANEKIPIKKVYDLTLSVMQFTMVLVAGTKSHR